MAAAGSLEVTVCVAIPKRTCQQLQTRRHAIAILEFQDLVHLADQLREPLGLFSILVNIIANTRRIDQFDPTLKIVARPGMARPSRMPAAAMAKITAEIITSTIVKPCFFCLSGIIINSIFLGA